MKRTAILSFALALGAFCAAAQTVGQGAAPARSEIVGYDTRKNSQTGDRLAVQTFVPFRPVEIAANSSVQTVGQIVEVPQIWNNRDMYLHIENPHGAYTLYVNDTIVGRSSDTRTPVEFYISPYVRHGNNAIVIDIDRTGEPLLSSSLGSNPRPQFENTYIYSQPKLRIYDYDIRFEPDSTRTYGILEVDIIAGNSYNYRETVNVGYDLYDPAGKLQDYNLREAAVEGRSVDTVRFRMPIYKTNQWLWSDRTPRLYKLTLYTKAGGIITEYIPLQIGFGRTEFDGRNILRNGKAVAIKAARYNAHGNRAAVLKEMKAMRTRGINTLYVDYPQVYWFYDLCEQLGFYVVDQADLNVSAGRGDRTVTGTPSNDPRYAGEYVDRVRRMYRRNRNRTCIIAWSLGGPSGNGYCMYKAYQWLKGQGDERPIVYVDSDGEWNSDWELPAAIE